MKRIVIPLAAAALAAIVAVTTVAADPTWPPRPIRCEPRTCIIIGKSAPQTGVTLCFRSPAWGGWKNRTTRPCAK